MRRAEVSGRPPNRFGKWEPITASWRQISAATRCEFIACLLDLGLPAEDIRKMVRTNPEKLLGLDP